MGWFATKIATIAGAGALLALLGIAREHLASMPEVHQDHVCSGLKNQGKFGRRCCFAVTPVYSAYIYIHTYNIYIIGICTGDIWWRKNKNPCLGQIKITKACLKHGLHHHKHQTIRGNFERTKLTYMHGWIHNFGEHGLLWTPIKTSLFHPIGSSAT